jgi:hypothetical protein
MGSCLGAARLSSTILSFSSSDQWRHRPESNTSTATDPSIVSIAVHTHSDPKRYAFGKAALGGSEIWGGRMATRWQADGPCAQANQSVETLLEVPNRFAKTVPTGVKSPCASNKCVLMYQPSPPSYAANQA